MYMINGDNLLLLSEFLFCIGFLGIMMESCVIKTFISIEIMMFAGIINFCYFSGNTSIRGGHFAILIGVTLGGLVLSIVFTVLNLQLKNNKSTDILVEDPENPSDD